MSRTHGRMPAVPTVIRTLKPRKPYRGDWVERLWAMPATSGHPAWLAMTYGPLGCPTCEADPYVRHDQCLYYGEQRHGHSASHCTADACY